MKIESRLGDARLVAILKKYIDYRLAYVIERRPNPDDPHGAALLIVRCPYCTKTHLHGSGVDELGKRDLGTRGSHCGSLRVSDRSTDYVILDLRPVRELRAEIASYVWRELL